MPSIRSVRAIEQKTNTNLHDVSRVECFLQSDELRLLTRGSVADIVLLAKIFFMHFFFKEIHHA